VAQQASSPQVEAVSRLYFFLLSDAYREFRETEVRWECYAASQYHFDDGVKFILEAVEADTPVDHPVWTLYSEKVAEIGARVAQAEERKLEMLGALKAVHQAFVRFCGARHLDPSRVAGLDQALPARVLELLRDDGVPPSGTVADEAYRLLVREWERNTPVGKAG
jgi:hypothetical protein